MKFVFTSMLKSPILHFMLLGAAAFAAYSHLKPTDRDIITVTTQTVDALVQQREDITQNPITAKERQELIAGHIEDEILLREAYKRGFDKNDYRVRKRILNIMRSSLSEVILERLIGVDASLAARARVPLLIYSLYSVIVVVRAYYHGIGLRERRTQAMAASAPARILAILVALILLPRFGIYGATLGIAALTAGFIAETVAVWWGVQGRQVFIR